MTIQQLAEATWNTLYPDRRLWNQLEQATRDEWIKVFRTYEQFRLNEVSTFKFGASRHDGFEN